MDSRTFTTFFALLAVLCNAAVLGWLALWLAGRVSPAAADILDRVVESVRGSAIALAWIVALAATLGSLYYSEIVGFDPCRLCWFQRIAMYPMAVILGIAALRRDLAVRFYAYPLAAIGAAIAGYHWLIQQFPSLDSGSCAVDGVACSGIYVERFGFVTIAWMAVSAFTMILVLLWLAGIADRQDDRGAVRSAAGS